LPLTAPVAPRHGSPGSTLPRRRGQDFASRSPVVPFNCTAARKKGRAQSFHGKSSHPHHVVFATSAHQRRGLATHCHLRQLPPWCKGWIGSNPVSRCARLPCSIKAPKGPNIAVLLVDAPRSRSPIWLAHHGQQIPTPAQCAARGAPSCLPRCHCGGIRDAAHGQATVHNQEQAAELQHDQGSARQA